MLTRHFYRCDEVVAALKASIGEGNAVHAVTWLNELIESDQIDEIISALVTCWIVMGRAAEPAWWGVAAMDIFAKDEIESSDVIGLCCELCYSCADAVTATLTAEAIAAKLTLDDIPLNVHTPPQQPRALSALALEPRQLEIPEPYKKGSIAELGLLCEKEMEGSAIWDSLFEEYGLDRSKGYEIDYGNTAGYEAFCQVAYGRLGHPDEWSPAEKLKSHCCGQAGRRATLGS